MRSTPSARPVSSERAIAAGVVLTTSKYDVPPPSRIFRVSVRIVAIEAPRSLNPVPYPELERRLDDLFRVVDRPIVAGQHQDEVHTVPWLPVTRGAARLECCYSNMRCGKCNID
jgi:hypothetical protein